MAWRYRLLSALLIAALSLIVPDSGHAQQAPPLNVQDALEMYEAATAKLVTYDVVTTFSHRPLILTETKGTPGEPDFAVIQNRRYREGEGPKPAVFFFHQSHQRSHTRIDTCDAAGGRAVKSYVSDGETERTFNSNNSTAGISSLSLSPFPHGVDYRAMYLNFTGNVPLVGCLRGRTNVVCRVENGLCHLESEGQTGAPSRLPGSGVHVAFDPDKGFLPVLIEEFQTRDGKRALERQMRIVKFKEVGSVKVPVEAITSHYDLRNLGTFGEIIGVETTTVDVSKSKWNIAIPDVRFELSIPAGTNVTDSTRNLRFITGKADPGRNMDELVKNAKDVMRFQNPPAEESEASSMWWIVGAVLVLTATLAFALRRGRRGLTS